MLIAFNKESHIQTFLLTSSPRKQKTQQTENVVEIKLNNFVGQNENGI